jgi:hypothetical protein
MRGLNASSDFILNLRPKVGVLKCLEWLFQGMCKKVTVSCIVTFSLNTYLMTISLIANKGAWGLDMRATLVYSCLT